MIPVVSFSDVSILITPNFFNCQQNPGRMLQAAGVEHHYPVTHIFKFMLDPIPGKFAPLWQNLF
jgi:hypothetical protein